ncbi:MAG: PSD1 domain-containing protein [Acidobacteriia bacterium]|nr:PSD1 domain-containing protein [Terriglobia bacterium]
MHRRSSGRKAAGTLLAAVSLAALVSIAAHGQKSQAPDAITILAKCGQCHGPAVQMGKLSLASRASLLQGGSHGPAVIPGDARNSPLYKRITGQEKPAMPMAPVSPLSAAEVAAIKDWIDQGARWPEQPNAAPASAVNRSGGLLVYNGYHERPITDADRQWWSFQKPVRPSIPRVKEARWNRSPIDALVKAKLEANGLSSASIADRNTLIRRAYLDLVGLLPSPSEVDAFVNDPSPHAYEDLVDRLLASPHYGERWARLWLDVARYSDSTGYEYDYDVSEAWRYRDYVIQAFNDDKPYGQFIMEQLAGDELDKPTHESVTATGFVRLGPRVLDRDLENPNYRFDYLDDIIRTTYQSFQALSVNCARCHDHKFDPITRKDYYKAVAVFNGFVEYDHPLVPADEWAKYQTAADKINKQVKALGQQVAAIEAPYRKEQFQRILAKFPADIQDAFRTPEEKRTPGQQLLAAQVATVGPEDDNAVDGPGPMKLSAEDEHARRKLLDEMARLTKQLPPRPPVALGVRDGDFRFIPHPPFQPGALGGIIYEKYGFRGKYLPEPGDSYEPPPAYFASNGLTPFSEEIKAPVVEPGILTVLAKPGEHSFADPPHNGYPTSGRRRALAEAIASKDNPLTARVMVNRVWYQHFGQGIVATPNNFGKMGAQPSNQKLLDWLATEFMERGWSIKQMHRLIMNSETYKMASGYYTPANAEKDPTNQLLWRFPIKRLEAEIIRDAVLSASGDLNLQAGGKPFFPPVPESVTSQVPTQGRWQKTEEGPATWRRSIYAYVKRNLKYPMFEVFDQPDAALSCERREVTTVPTQALTLFNNEFFLLQSRHLAERVAREAGNDPRAQITRLYRIAFSRGPSDRELSRALSFLSKQGKPGEAAALAEFAHVIFNANEFLYTN